LAFALWYARLAYIGFFPAPAPERSAVPGVAAMTCDDFSLEGLKRPVLVDCWASWCKNCAAMDAVLERPKVAAALRKQVENNPKRTVSGYRVRIFFDNKQSARTESEEALKKFESMFHEVKAYRTYANPYFKVTAGDFRTKSEAMAFLNRIKVNFPSAFVVKESIAYPVVDKDNSYVVDTIKVLRPKVR
jgi:thiol-disulfide isomerase/thioredoxin